MKISTSPSKTILSIVISLLLLSSSANAADEKKDKNLRGKVVKDTPDVEDTIPMQEDILGVEDFPADIPTVEDIPDGPMLEVQEATAYDEGMRLLSSHDNEDIAIYNGIWGGWKMWRKTDKRGLYACGAEIRFEDSVGGGDDTAANGLRLRYCGLADWYNQQQQEVWSGIWGGWKGMEMCPYGKYIGAATVRFEDWVGGGDDTALNGLAIWCVDKNWRYGELKIVYSGLWGTWKPWSYRFGKLVKGARVRFEDWVGGGDDTAMNGIQFNIEKPNFGVSDAQITGEWVAVATAPQGQLTHKIIESTATTQTKAVTKEETYGFTQSISAGFKIKVLDFSATVTASQSYRTARTMTHSLQVYKGTETTVGCPSSGSPTGYYTMWQFKMSQPSSPAGIGFDSNTKHIRCTPSFSQPPRCAIGSCKDTFCQKCLG